MRISTVTLRQRAAFTLMEMAVVLSIIGLLIGAVIGGQELMKQSELQTVLSDYGKYTGAVAQFRQQYGSLPGDILDATNFWGDDATSTESCADANVVNGSPGSCNGNGDGVIGGSAELARGWQHLMLAKYVQGNYNGLAGAGATLGTNVPRSRISNTGWTFYNNTSVAGTGNWFNQDVGNALNFGAPLGDNTFSPGITSSDAWQVDKKVDDGAPNTGKVIVQKPTFASTPNCATTSVEATTAYKTTYTGIACHLLMGMGIK